MRAGSRAIAVRRAARLVEDTVAEDIQVTPYRLLNSTFEYILVEQSGKFFSRDD